MCVCVYMCVCVCVFVCDYVIVCVCVYMQPQDLKCKGRKQSDAASCGLFALAYAYSLCEGLDPSQLVYESQKFRSHFSYCIKKKEMTKFDCKAAI